MDEIAVLKLVRRAVDKAAVKLSFHAEIEKALEAYDLQRAYVLHILTSAEQAVADGARPGIWTIVDIDGDDIFVRTVHGWPRGDE